MNILADFHHSDLWWSLQLLANRLGATLYRPYGMDWYTKRYFKLYGDLSKSNPEEYVAKKYLEDTIYTKDKIHGIGEETLHGDNRYPTFKLLTTDFLKTMKIDIVICSVNENEEPFLRLKEFYPHAKFIRQVGNDLDVNTIYPNLLSSAISPYRAFNGHKILYRPEFDLNLFRCKKPIRFQNIYTFQNNLEKFEDTFSIWTNLRHQLREFTFKSYGRENDDGNIYDKRRCSRKMIESSFIFQSKGQWEGYGFIIHQAICLGRPMIVKYSDYKDKIAEPLLVENKTYLEMSDPQLPEKIKFYSQPDRLNQMFNKCTQVFEENINFDEEFDYLKEFFNNLI